MSSTFSSDNKLAVFDLDGTLVNTISDLAKCVDMALGDLGLPGRTLDEYTDFVGNGTYLLVRRSLPDGLSGNEELCRKAHELFCSYYSVHYSDSSYIYDGIIPVLSDLKQSGVKLAVLTNKPDRFAGEMISKLFGNDVFDIVVGSKDGVPKKPDPAAENEIISLMCANRQSVIHVGDSDIDVITAHNAGVKCIGCTWGFRTEQSLKESDADVIVRTPAELLKAFEDLGFIRT